MHPGLTTDERRRLKQLERENEELRRANEILKAASAFCAGGAGPLHQKLIEFTSTVSAIGAGFSKETVLGLLCKRSQSDEERCSHIQCVWHANWQFYDAVKVCKQLHREWLSIACCTVQHLMFRLGLEGARRGKKVHTTRPAMSARAFHIS